jgi:hypothetical protein
MEVAEFRVIFTRTGTLNLAINDQHVPRNIHLDLRDDSRGSTNYEAPSAFCCLLRTTYEYALVITYHVRTWATAHGSHSFATILPPSPKRLQARSTQGKGRLPVSPCPALHTGDLHLDS